jgi:hypothetical protein
MTAVMAVPLVVPVFPASMVLTVPVVLRGNAGQRRRRRTDQEHSRDDCPHYPPLLHEVPFHVDVRQTLPNI